MALERRVAWAGAVGGPTWGLLMWGLRGLGWVPPHTAYVLAVVGGGIGVSIAACIWLHIGWVWLRSKGWLEAASIVAASAVILGGAGGGLWYYFLQQPAKLSAVSPPHATQNPYENRVALQCWMARLPTVGPYAVMELFWSHVQPDILLGLGGQMGGPAIWPNGTPDMGYQCNVTNYNRIPIFKILLVFPVRYNGVVHIPHAITGGHLVQSLNRPIQIAQIGISGTYTFYVWNASREAFATVWLPSKVSFVPLGDDRRQNVDLILPGDLGLSLDPTQQPIPAEPQTRKHKPAAISDADPSPATPHARVKVERFDFVPVDPPDGTGDMVARAFYKNLGAATGYTPAFAYNAYIGDPFSLDKYNAIFEDIRKTALTMPLPRNTELEPNGLEAFEPVARIRAADWNDITHGKKTFYAWIVSVATDSNLPKNEGFVSEFAIVKGADSGYMIKRNRSYFTF